jgi:two-component system phosphate regulon sensor histidine kinase PhoR
MVEQDVRQRFLWRGFLKMAVSQAAVVVLALGFTGVVARHYLDRDAHRSLLAYLFFLAVALCVLMFRTGRSFFSSIEEVFTESVEEVRKDLESKTESLNLEREELGILMSSISDAVLAVDREGGPLFYNSRFALVFEEAGLGKKPLKLWEIFRDPGILDAFQTALKAGRAASGRAVPIDVTGKPRQFFSLSVSPLLKRNGEVYGAVGIFHDVTDLKAAEQIRIDFVANVSHELRTPLTAIKGYTDTLMQDVAANKPVEKSFLEIISRNVERLMSLISDLLDLSSLESMGVIHKTPVNTQEITERVVRQLSHVFEAKGHKVSMKIAVPVVTADAKRLEQVIVNLLDNAAKYTPSGGEIAIVWESIGIANGEETLFRVTDSGPGIPPEHHARLFERFYRVDKARSRELGGTGLGLSIVKHIMQRHDGSVSVESVPGKGATFTCRFPGGRVS